MGARMLVSSTSSSPRAHYDRTNASLALRTRLLDAQAAAKAAVLPAGLVVVVENDVVERSRIEVERRGLAYARNGGRSRARLSSWVPGAGRMSEILPHRDVCADAVVYLVQDRMVMNVAHPSRIHQQNHTATRLFSFDGTKGLAGVPRSEDHWVPEAETAFARAGSTPSRGRGRGGSRAPSGRRRRHLRSLARTPRASASSTCWPCAPNSTNSGPSASWDSSSRSCSATTVHRRRLPPRPAPEPRRLFAPRRPFVKTMAHRRRTIDDDQLHRSLISAPKGGLDALGQSPALPRGLAGERVASDAHVRRRRAVVRPGLPLPAPGGRAGSGARRGQAPGAVAELAVALRAPRRLLRAAAPVRYQADAARPPPAPQQRVDGTRRRST